MKFHNFSANVSYVNSRFSNAAANTIEHVDSQKPGAPDILENSF